MLQLLTFSFCFHDLDAIYQLFLLAITYADINLKRYYTLMNNDLPGSKTQIFFEDLMNSYLLPDKSIFDKIMQDCQRPLDMHRTQTVWVW